MQREIKSCQSTITPLDVPSAQQLESLSPWLNEQASAHALRWMLAHTMSGVIWGALRGDRFHLSSEAFPDHFAGVSLDWLTLHQCRLFGEAGELLLWQAGRQWQACMRHDDAPTGEATLYLDETHLLWGNREMPGRNSANGFLVLAEGRQGIVHAPPLQKVPTGERRAALRVRHYVAEEADTGLLRITASRLIELLEPAEHTCH